MKLTRYIGLGIFLLALGIFTVSITLSKHTLTKDTLQKIDKKYHRAMIAEQGQALLGETKSSNIAFVNDLRPILKKAQKALDEKSGVNPEKGVWNATNLPEGVSEWDYRMGDHEVKSYLFTLTKHSAHGALPNNSWLFFWLTFILGSLGALIYMAPTLKTIPGIKHNGIYHSPLHRGLQPIWQLVAVAVVLLGCLVVMLMNGAIFWLLGTIAITAFILGIIYWKEGKAHDQAGQLPNSSTKNGWLGILLGIYLITFYIVLYFYPYYMTNWVLLVEPLKQAIGGANAEASQWFLYGFLYTLVMIVMGIRMLIKYRHNKYQLIRTGSVIFFQLAFAFIIPELLARFNNPAMDLKNAWPLDYDFYYGYNIENHLEKNDNYILGGFFHVGTLMFVWGIALTFILVPLLSYFYGKRWYCSWVCGCGGLAETLGDPFRQQSDKSLRAWRIERWVIHGVMVLAIIMTGLVIYTYQTGESQVLGLDSYNVRSWYGFLVGSMFAGVVGTGFYPLMGNRVWCRFGCPLAAMLGLVQRFKSRFRITTNGGQCISCGNCSTYCEMGIDVRWYAQRGQDIVRASCVGCGVCSAVCPRGVLRLENSSEDINTRAEETRVIHISMDEVKLMD